MEHDKVLFFGVIERLAVQFRCVVARVCVCACVRACVCERYAKREQTLIKCHEFLNIKCTQIV